MSYRAIVGVVLTLSLSAVVDGASSEQSEQTEQTEHQHHDHAGEHIHDPSHVIDVAGVDAPGLLLEASLGAAGAVDLRLHTRNFRFSQEHADGPHIAGEGHAHLYVDEQKIGRVYAEQHMLEKLKPGVHRIVVGLYANNHAAYQADGLPVEAVAVVRIPRGARSNPSSHRVELDFPGASKTQTARVSKNQLVSLVLTATEPMVLHLHGYDLEAAVGPARPAVLHFVADIAGRFPIERHGEKGGGHNTVAFVEVYPD